MKKGIKIGLIIPILLISSKVYAECNNNELNDWAEKVSIEYKDNLKSGDYNYLLLVSPYNELATVKVVLDDKEYLIDYDSDYKTNVIGSNIHFDEKKYIIKFYGNEKSGCNNELLRELEYKVPGYNKYSDYEYCNNNKNLEICKTNTDNKNLSDEEFNKKIVKEEVEEKTILSFIKNYWCFVIVPIVIVAAIYYYKVYLLKKKENKK